MNELVLASSSPYRKQQLKQLGLEFRAQSPHCDEDEFKKMKLPHKELCTRLAFEKAFSLKKDFPQASIIGSDQIAVFEGEQLNKPGNLKKAAEQIYQMSGKTHQLMTSVCILDSKGQAHQHIDISEIRLRPLSYEQCENYVAKDQSQNCAAGYKIESAGIALIESLKTNDPSAIIGLPMIATTGFLMQLGFSIF